MLITFFRMILIYLLIIFSLRLMGKRQLGQLQPSELVVTILVSNIATMSIEDTNVPLLAGIVPVLTLVGFDVLLSALSLKSKSARRVLSGTPRVIIRDGKLVQSQMRVLRFSIDDVMAQLRTNNIFDINDVAFAIVETTGALSVYPKFQAQPLTPKAMQIPTPPGADAPPVVIISDGIVIDSGLRYCNLQPEWMQKTLKEKGITEKQIFLMTCDRQANYTIVMRETKLSGNSRGVRQ